MRPLAFLAVIIACFAAPMAQAAGFRFIDIPAAARNCPVAGDSLPLIVVSHGSGGWFGAHHDTAAMLADAGFVVAALNHPGDNAADRSRTDNLSVLLDRPAAIRRLTDFMLDAWPDPSKLDRQRIGLFGFSRGAYTGLVIAGGRLARPRIYVSLPPFWPTWSWAAPSLPKA